MHLSRWRRPKSFGTGDRANARLFDPRISCRGDWSKRHEVMLKISIVDSGAQRRLVLDGALVPRSLMDLRTAWLKASAEKQGPRIVLVFRNVTQNSNQHRGRSSSLGINDQGSQILLGKSAEQADYSATHQKKQIKGIGTHCAVDRKRRAMKVRFGYLMARDANKFSAAFSLNRHKKCRKGESGFGHDRPVFASGAQKLPSISRKRDLPFSSKFSSNPVAPTCVGKKAPMDVL